MTLAAPRSRQGRLTLALAILAAAVAVVGAALLWSSEAEADINTNLATVTVTDNLAGDPVAGQTVTYTFTIACPGGSPCSNGTTTNTELIMALDGGTPGGLLGANA